LHHRAVHGTGALWGKWVSFSVLILEKRPPAPDLQKTVKPPRVRLYGFLQGAWPFGVIEAIWAVIAPSPLANADAGYSVRGKKAKPRAFALRIVLSCQLGWAHNSA
jgi:hypothetical protein